MKTGFTELDKIINIEKSQLIIISGHNFVEEFSGDIAQNVCVKQECEVLELIGCKKEYLIKRLMVNYANVNYKNWTRKDNYSNEEFIQIGKKIVDLIETTKRLPTIIEDYIFFGSKEIIRIISNFANSYADRKEVDSLIILDIYPLNSQHKDSFNRIEKDRCLRFIKKMKKISKKLNCTIMIIDNVEITKKYNVNRKNNDLKKQDIDDIDRINRCVDTYIILNPDIHSNNLYKIDVYDNERKIGCCNLKYNFECRRFENI